jgi:DNA-binding transcriptional LysR family regulator
MTIDILDGQWNVEIRQIRALVSIARTRSFSRTAEALGYAQSAVSAQIAGLERACGTPLVVRPGGPRAVSLTEAGRIVVRHGERVLARLDVARGDLAALAAGEAGTLRVGTFQSVGAHLLPDILRRFRVAWPEIDVRIVEDQQEHALLDLLLEGALDVTFALTAGLDPRFEWLDLVSDPWVLLAPPGSPLAGGGPVRFHDIDGLPVIEWVNRGHLELVREELRLRGATPNVVFRTDDNLTLQHFVSAGLGHAIVGELVVERGNVEWPVLTLPIEEGLAPRPIGVVWARDRLRRRAMSAFIDVARTVASAVSA